MTPSPSPDHDPHRWTSPFEELLGQQPDTPAMEGDPGSVRHPNPILGTPGQDAAFTDGPQRYNDDCAIKCQQWILQQFTGHPVNEDALVREAFDHGWYLPGGTPPQDVGKLLELHGIGVTRFEHANQFQLAMELSQGHKVIVGVNSEQLWHHNPLLSGLRDVLGIPGNADHAVLVSGIDTTDPHHVLVQVSDPGTGEPLATYPLEQFLDAWGPGEFYMVATKDPAPPHLPEMAHFDYNVGHIPAIADIPYDHFLTFVDQPQAWEHVVHHYVEVHHDIHIHHHLHDMPIPESGVPDMGHADAAAALPYVPMDESASADSSHANAGAPPDSTPLHEGSVSDPLHSDAVDGSLNGPFHETDSISPGSLDVPDMSHDLTDAITGHDPLADTDAPLGATGDCLPPDWTT